MQTCVAMLEEGYDLKLRVPKMFSTTRFANFLHQLYRDFRGYYAGLIATLDEVKSIYHSSSDARQRERAQTADMIEGRIFTVKWSLSLSVNCDVYQVYGIGVNILQVWQKFICMVVVICQCFISQTVNAFPFENYDKFLEHVLDHYKLMLTAIKIKNCPCSSSQEVMETEHKERGEEESKAGDNREKAHTERNLEVVCLDSDEDDNIEEIMDEGSDEENTKEGKASGEEQSTLDDKSLCYWPTLHSDLLNLTQNNVYMGVPMGILVAEKFKTRSAHAQNTSNLDVKREEVIEKVEERAEKLVSYLLKGLSAKVFSPEDIIVIEHTRTLLDLEAVMDKVAMFGAVQVSNTMFHKFFEASKFFDHNLELEVRTTDYRSMFTEFLRRLETLHQQQKKRKHREPTLQKKKVRKGGVLNSKEILSIFLDPVNNIYKDIETLLNILCRAAVSKSVESVVESWISQSEKHASGGRPLGQERMEDEAMISINGPKVAHCASVVQAAHTEYWSRAKRSKERDGHFLRRSEQIKQYTVSKVIDNMRSEKPKLPFMS